MLIVNLYNGIYKELANDNIILGFLGIDTSLSASKLALEKAKHIQKRAIPQRVLESLPVITLYTTGGKRESRNDVVFNSVFVFDVYTSDDVELAHDISNRIFELFDGVINPFMGVENFEAGFIDGHESVVNLANIYCFTTLINMSITLDRQE